MTCVAFDHVTLHCQSACACVCWRGSPPLEKHPAGPAEHTHTHTGSSELYVRGSMANTSEAYTSSWVTHPGPPSAPQPPQETHNHAVPRLCSYCVSQVLKWRTSSEALEQNLPVPLADMRGHDGYWRRVCLFVALRTCHQNALTRHHLK